jgi:deoxyadenosine kinase
MFLLHHRFAQHQGMVWGGESCIQDRSIFEDLCFAHLHNKAGNISDLDFTTYRMAYQNMNNFLHKPDLLIFLDVSVDTAMARIAKRKAEDPRRACERSIDAGYLTALKSEYEDFITSGLGGRIPVLRLDWNVPLTVDEVIAKLHTMVKHKIAM